MRDTPGERPPCLPYGEPSRPCGPVHCQAVYDPDLHLEAYRFKGVAQPFPSHFHDYYVIGLVERGERNMICRGKEYLIGAGDILVFHPGDSHSCVQSGGETMDYRGMNLSKPVMAELAGEINGREGPPLFGAAVIRDEEVRCCFRSLHGQVMAGETGFCKEENLILLLSLLMERWGQAGGETVPDWEEKIRSACRFMEDHCGERIRLDEICRHAGLSKSTLLRAFTRAKGVTPYCYLENIRVEAARKLLKQGAAPAEAALSAGFSDQSHFTNYFSRFIGLSPGAYRDIFWKRGRD